VLGLDVEFSMFLSMFLTGAAAGMAFDLYRGIPLVAHARGAVRHLFDLLLWVVLTPLILTGFLLGNWGELRLYVALGLALGFGVYRMTAGPAVRAAWRQVFVTVAKIRLFLGRVVAPVRRTVRRLAGALFSAARPPNDGGRPPG
jgi:spore cortex biosynthesis protein YabQ